MGKVCPPLRERTGERKLQDLIFALLIIRYGHVKYFPLFPTAPAFSNCAKAVLPARTATRVNFIMVNLIPILWCRINKPDLSGAAPPLPLSVSLMRDEEKLHHLWVCGESFFFFVFPPFSPIFKDKSFPVGKSFFKRKKKKEKALHMSVRHDTDFKLPQERKSRWFRGAIERNEMLLESYTWKFGKQQRKKRRKEFAAAFDWVLSSWQIYGV